jgi:hypothetical protein
MRILLLHRMNFFGNLAKQLLVLLCTLILLSYQKFQFCALGECAELVNYHKIRKNFTISAYFGTKTNIFEILKFYPREVGMHK